LARQAPRKRKGGRGWEGPPVGRRGKKNPAGKGGSEYRGVEKKQVSKNETTKTGVPGIKIEGFLTFLGWKGGRHFNKERGGKGTSAKKEKRNDGPIGKKPV